MIRFGNGNISGPSQDGRIQVDRQSDDLETDWNVFWFKHILSQNLFAEIFHSSKRFHRCSSNFFCKPCWAQWVMVHENTLNVKRHRPYF